jgi:predicted Rossmann fold nucleotide-binding protein DprA/Smf involved in DNA uptake
MLIRQGAQVITSPQEFARDLGLVCGSSSEFRVGTESEPLPADLEDALPAALGDDGPADLGDDAPADHRDDGPTDLDREARRVWLALGQGSLGVDDVAAGANLQSARVLAALTVLQIAGLVVQEAGMRFRRAS